MDAVQAMRKEFKANVRFVLMNSFSTSADTMTYLAKYPNIVSDPDLERILRLKAEEILYDMFTWGEGEFRFLDGELPPSETLVPLSLDVTGVVLEEREVRRVGGNDGALDVRSYRTPGEIAEFLRLVRPLDERTYQTRLLGVGLPQGEQAEQEAIALAADDSLRAFLLFQGGEPLQPELQDLLRLHVRQPVALLVQPEFG